MLLNRHEQDQLHALTSRPAFREAIGAALDKAIATASAEYTARRSDDAPCLDPKNPAFNITSAMGWAKGDPAREAALKKVMAGGVR